MEHSILSPNGKRVIIEIIILSQIDGICSEPYTHDSYGDNAFLDCNKLQDENIQPILREKVEVAVEALKEGKDRSAGVDNIPAEFVQAGG